MPEDINRWRGELVRRDIAIVGVISQAGIERSDQSLDQMPKQERNWTQDYRVDSHQAKSMLTVPWNTSTAGPVI